MPFICPLCPSELTTGLNLHLSGLLKHVELFHSHQLSFSITCGIGGCLRTFHNFKVFRNHVYSIHGGDPSNQSAHSHVEELEPANDNTDFNDSQAGVSDQSLSVENLSKPTALFLMGMKEKYKLTQAALQGIVEGVTSLIKGRLSALHAQINTIIPDSVSPEIKQNLDHLFSDDGEFCCPFLGLETQHQQLKFYQSHFDFVVS